MKSFPKGLFSLCSQLLSGDELEDELEIEPAVCLLQDLGYLNSDRVFVDNDLSHQQRLLLSIAEQIELFPLSSPTATKTLFLGGVVDPGTFPGFNDYLPLSISGVGLDFQTTFESCVGEGIERLCKLDHDNTTAETVRNIEKESKRFELSKNLFVENGYDQHLFCTASRHIVAHSLSDESPLYVPKEHVLHIAKPIENNMWSSSGCAAGYSRSDATYRALLELIERDAIALWWEGCVQGRALSIETMSMAGVEQLFQRSGRNPENRMTSIFDITTDIGIPSVAAVSVNTSSKDEFAFGFSSRAGYGEAIRKALLEMFQMELGHTVRNAKISRFGLDRLNKKDHEQLLRDQYLQTHWSIPMFKALDFAEPTVQGELNHTDVLETILHKLSNCGFDAYAIDLTHKGFGVPVVQAVVPGLQSYPKLYNSPRLSQNKGRASRDVDRVCLL